jgi:hypothetical protein
MIAVLNYRNGKSRHLHVRRTYKNHLKTQQNTEKCILLPISDGNKQIKRKQTETLNLSQLFAFSSPRRGTGIKGK